MGFWEKLKKKKKEEMTETRVLGWDAITKECQRIYPGQPEPAHHYASLIKWVLGGNDPLDGISVYDGGNYWHFITYGLSELYEKESDDKEISGYGMEFTFKLKKGSYENEEGEIKCICGILQAIARITFTKGEIFRAYEYLYTGQTEGIDTKMQSDITGFITIPSPDFQTIDTPNGRLAFIEFIGVTNSELLAIQNQEFDVKQLYQKLGSDITDYNRKSVV